MKPYRRSKKIVGGFTLLFFCWQTVSAYGMPVLALIPKSIGQVQSTQSQSSSKTAILVLNAHTSSDAQKNISELLRFFQSQGIDLIGLEGADQKIDGQIFRSFPFKDSLAQAAWQMVKEGQFTGAEYFYITSEKLPNFFGLEDKELYLKNRDAFIQTNEAAEKLTDTIENLSGSISSLKKRIYSKKLSNFDEQVQQYEQNNMNYIDYVGFVIAAAKKAHINIPDFPNLYALSKAADKEKKISQKKLHKDLEKIRSSLRGGRQADANRLSGGRPLGRLAPSDRLGEAISEIASAMNGTLPRNDGAAESSDDIFDRYRKIHAYFSTIFNRHSVPIGTVLTSNKNSMRVRTERSEEFHTRSFAPPGLRMTLQLKDFKHFSAYFEWLSLMISLDSTRMFDELSQLTQLTYDRLSSNEKEKKLIRLSQSFKRFRQMISIQLTQPDWEQIVKDLSLRGGRQADEAISEIALLTSPDQPSLALMRGALFGKDLTSFSESAGTRKPSGRPPLNQPAFARDDAHFQITDSEILLLKKAEESARHFYELAEKRNQIFADRIEQEMNRKKKDISVIVLGGFHEKGLKATLQAKGISVSVISPKISEALTDIPYFERMIGKPTQFESVLTQASTLEAALKISEIISENDRIAASQELHLLAAVNELLREADQLKSRYPEAKPKDFEILYSAQNDKVNQINEALENLKITKFHSENGNGSYSLSIQPKKGHASIQIQIEPNPDGPKILAASIEKIPAKSQRFQPQPKTPKNFSDQHWAKVAIAAAYGLVSFSAGRRAELRKQAKTWKEFLDLVVEAEEEAGGINEVVLPDDFEIDLENGYILIAGRMPIFFGLPSDFNSLGDYLQFVLQTEILQEFSPNLQPPFELSLEQYTKEGWPWDYHNVLQIVKVDEARILKPKVEASIKRLRRKIFLTWTPSYKSMRQQVVNVLRTFGIDTRKDSHLFEPNLHELTLHALALKNLGFDFELNVGDYQFRVQEPKRKVEITPRRAETRNQFATGVTLDLSANDQGKTVREILVQKTDQIRENGITEPLSPSRVLGLIGPDENQARSFYKTYSGPAAISNALGLKVFGSSLHLIYPRSETRSIEQTTEENPMPPIIWAGEPIALRIGELGGKVSNSAKMKQAGLDVPNFYALTNTAMQQFYAVNPEIMTRASELILGIDADEELSAGQVERAIKSAVANGTMPDELKELIEVSFKQLAREEGYEEHEIAQMLVAIRSSARMEDLPGVPAAGIQDTNTNISYAHLIENVQDIWGSLFNRRAIAYRDKTALFFWLRQIDRTQLAVVADLFAQAMGREEELTIPGRISSVPKQRLLERLRRMASAPTMNELKLDEVYISTKQIQIIFDRIQNHPKGKDIVQNLRAALQEQIDNFVNPRNVGMSALVQVMRPSEISLVAFSVNKASGWTGFTNGLDVVVFEASYGLGEYVVEGKVNPDTYIVARRKQANGQYEYVILDKMLGTKEKMLKRNPETGIEIEAEVPQELREKFTLTDQKILEVAQKTFEARDVLNRGREGQEAPAPVDTEAVLYRTKDGELKYNIVQMRDVQLFRGFDFQRPEIMEIIRKVIPTEEKRRAINEGKFVGKGFSTSGAAVGQTVWVEDIKVEQVHEALERIANGQGDVSTLSALIPKEHPNLFSNDELQGEVNRAKNERQFAISGIMELAEHLGQNQIKEILDVSRRGMTKRQAQAQFRDQNQKRAIGFLYDAAPTDSVLRDRLLLTVYRVFIEKGNLANELLNEQSAGFASLILNKQFSKLQAMIDKGQDIILFAPETNPNYNEMMAKVRGTITLQGGETSHAIVIAGQWGYSVVGGMNFDETTLRNKPDLIQKMREGIDSTIDANDGSVYTSRLPLEEESLLYPVTQWQQYGGKVGLIAAAPVELERATKLGLYPGHYGVSLARVEDWLIAEIGVNFRAALAYDRMRALAAKELQETQLSAQQLADVRKMQESPDEQAKIAQKIKGYESAEKFVRFKLRSLVLREMATLTPNQIVQIRAMDFKKNESRDRQAGARLYFNEEPASMIGDRGTGLEVRDENIEGLDLQLMAISDAKKEALRLGNVGKIGFMLVFIRRTSDLKKALSRIEELYRQHKIILPDQVGVMFELTINALLSDRFAKILADWRDHMKQTYGDREDFPKAFKTYFSHGTNDMTQSVLGDRDERRYQRMQVYLPDAYEPVEVRVFDEADPAVFSNVLHGTAAAKRNGIDCGLCGQAMVNLIQRGTQGALAAAAKLAVNLDSAGTDVKTYARTVKLRADAELAAQSVPADVADDAHALLRGTSFGTGAAKRRIVIIQKSEDLWQELKGRRIPRVVAGDILVLPVDLKLEPALTEAVDRASGVIVSGTHVQDGIGTVIRDRHKPAIFSSSRIRTEDAKLAIANLVNGETYTVDFERGAVYSKNTNVVKVSLVDNTPYTQINLDQPVELQTMPTVRFSMDDVYREIGIHPLALALYAYAPPQKLHKPEIQKPAARAKMESLFTEQGINTEMRQRIVNEVSELLLKRNVDSVGELIEQSFFKLLEEKTKGISSQATVVFETSQADAEFFRGLAEGDKLELPTVNAPIAFRGLLKTISPGHDEIFLMFLDAFNKALWDPKQRNPFAIQLNYVQNPKVLELALQFLASQDLKSGQHGLEIGMNIATSANFINAEGFLAQGIRFITIEPRLLLMNFALADLNNQVMLYDGSMQPLVSTEEPEFKEALQIATQMVKTVSTKHGVKLTIPAEALDVPKEVGNKLPDDYEKTIKGLILTELGQQTVETGTSTIVDLLNTFDQSSELALKEGFASNPIFSKTAVDLFQEIVKHPDSLRVFLASTHLLAQMRGFPYIFKLVTYSIAREPEVMRPFLENPKARTLRPFPEMRNDLVARLEPIDRRYDQLIEAHQTADVLGALYENRRQEKIAVANRFLALEFLKRFMNYELYRFSPPLADLMRNEETLREAVNLNRFLMKSVTELSNLVLQSVFDINREYLQTQYGAPSSAGGIVLGGSHSRDESPTFDYDAIFVYGAQGQTAGGVKGHISNQAFYDEFAQLTEASLALMGRNYDARYQNYFFEQFAKRKGLNLKKPWAISLADAQGAFVSDDAESYRRSLDSFLFLNAAGDSSVTQEFIRLSRSGIHTEEMLKQALADISLSFKNRTEKNGSTIDIKRDRGSLRTIHDVFWFLLLYQKLLEIRGGGFRFGNSVLDQEGKDIFTLSKKLLGRETAKLFQAYFIYLLNLRFALDLFYARNDKTLPSDQQTLEHFAHYSHVTSVANGNTLSPPEISKLFVDELEETMQRINELSGQTILNALRGNVQTLALDQLQKAPELLTEEEMQREEQKFLHRIQETARMEEEEKVRIAEASSKSLLEELTAIYSARGVSSPESWAQNLIDSDPAEAERQVKQHKRQTGGRSEARAQVIVTYNLHKAIEDEQNLFTENIYAVPFANIGPNERKALETIFGVREIDQTATYALIMDKDKFITIGRFTPIRSERDQMRMGISGLVLQEKELRLLLPGEKDRRDNVDRVIREMVIADAPFKITTINNASITRARDLERNPAGDNQLEITYKIRSETRTVEELKKPEVKADVSEFEKPVPQLDRLNAAELNPVKTIDLSDGLKVEQGIIPVNLAINRSEARIQAFVDLINTQKRESKTIYLRLTENEIDSLNDVSRSEVWQFFGTLAALTSLNHRIIVVTPNRQAANDFNKLFDSFRLQEGISIPAQAVVTAQYFDNGESLIQAIGKQWVNQVYFLTEIAEAASLASNVTEETKLIVTDRVIDRGLNAVNANLLQKARLAVEAALLRKDAFQVTGAQNNILIPNKSVFENLISSLTNFRQATLHILTQA